MIVADQFLELGRRLGEGDLGKLKLVSYLVREDGAKAGGINRRRAVEVDGGDAVECNVNTPVERRVTATLSPGAAAGSPLYSTPRRVAGVLAVGGRGATSGAPSMSTPSFLSAPVMIIVLSRTSASAWQAGFFSRALPGTGLTVR